MNDKKNTFKLSQSVTIYYNVNIANATSFTYELIARFSQKVGRTGQS